MPLRRPDAPSFYLDLSTLSNAYDAILVGRSGDSAWRDLRTWIERLSREANLCLSSVHLIELSQRTPDAAGAMAVWLDALDVTWVRTQTWVEHREDERLLKHVVGVDADAVDPFTPSLLKVFEEAWTIDQLADALSDPSLPNVVRQIRARDVAGERRFIPDWLDALQRDRRLAEDNGVTEAQLREALALNWRVGLRRRAGEAHERLSAHLDVAYLSSGARWGDAMDPFVEAFIADESLMPGTAIMRAFSQGFEKETADRRPGSRKVLKAYGSMFWDLVHAAVGAGYCDVFNCDAAMGRCLGEVRERLGRTALIAQQPGEAPTAFVGRLMNTWP